MVPPALLRVFLNLEISLSMVETEGMGTASLPSPLLLVFLNHR